MLWDAAWDQQNVIEGKAYSDHIADIMSKSGGVSGPSTTPGTGAASTPAGSTPVGPTPGGSTPTTSPTVVATPPSPGGGGVAGMLILTYLVTLKFIKISGTFLLALQ